MMIITTIGEILIDMTQTDVDGNGVIRFAANPGGAPANVAVAASRLGAQTAFIGCVGNDSFGEILRNTLVLNNVNTDGLQSTDRASTTIAVVTVDAKGERTFSFLRKPGADTCIDPMRAVADARGTGILHFGSVSLTDENCRQAVHMALKAAKDSGALISYDPNYRASLWPDRDTAIRHMREVLPLCDIVKISDEETALLTGEEDPAKAASVLVNMGASLVLVTLGADGACYRTPSFRGHVDGYKVKVADTNGAGDTFFGAILGKIARRGGLGGIAEEELREIIRFANRAASLTASRHGAIPAMPVLEEMQKPYFAAL